MMTRLYQDVLVWFRRDLRCEDHHALSQALADGQRVWCAFVFDREILDALPSRRDRRVLQAPARGRGPRPRPRGRDRANDRDDGGHDRAHDGHDENDRGPDACDHARDRGARGHDARDHGDDGRDHDHDDDARGRAAAQAEGIADGDDPIADAGVVGFTETDVGKG